MGWYLLFITASCDDEQAVTHNDTATGMLTDHTVFSEVLSLAPGILGKHVFSGNPGLLVDLKALHEVEFCTLILNSWI
jgi:hypothetical protein